MTKRWCWTCNTDHDLDGPCPNSGVVRSRQEAIGSMNSMVDDAGPVGGLGPIFTATYESECDACEEVIARGEDIRAWPGHGYIHAGDQCERLARGHG